MTKEIMSIWQLELFSGGTKAEFKELQDVLPQKTTTWYTKYGKRYTRTPMNESKVIEWLKDNLKIDATIDSGGLFSQGERNIYRRIGTNEYIAHGTVID